MGAIDAFTTASESYSDWENVVVAVLVVAGFLGLMTGLPGMSRDWLGND